MTYGKPIHTEEICFWVSDINIDTDAFFKSLKSHGITHSIENIDQDGIIEVNAFEKDFEEITRLRNQHISF